MRRTRDNPRERFSTVAGVRALFRQEKWPTPPEQIDQPDYLIAQAQTFESDRKSDAKFSFDLMPNELFALAVDTLVGPFAEFRSLRFRAAIQMARRTSYELGHLVRKGGQTVYADHKVAGMMVRRAEGALKRPAGNDVRLDLSLRLAAPLGVSAQWLAGIDQNEASVGRSLTQLVEQAAGTYVPSWLTPWVAAVKVAVSICEIVDQDLLLTDPDYAGEMLEAFITRHRQRIDAHPAAWSLMLYYPKIHPELVAARDRTLRRIPRWMRSSDGIPAV